MNPYKSLYYSPKPRSDVYLSGCLSMEINTWLFFFLRKCVQTAAKTMVVDRKKNH